MCYKLHMNRVGVRELRQRASELLRRVTTGETIEITDRGRPVALLTPLPEGTPLERLRASGEVDVAISDFSGIGEPLELAPGREPPSSVLARLRRDER
jgi:prevent-host-death family protein